MEFALPCANIAEYFSVVVYRWAIILIYPYSEKNMSVPVFKFVYVVRLIRFFNVKPFASTVRALNLCHKNLLHKRSHKLSTQF